MRFILGFTVLTALSAACSSGSTATSTSTTGSTGTGGKKPGTGGSGGAGGAPINMCSAAIDMLLKPVDQVSSGAVSVVTNTGGVATLYVDASAGGFGNSDTSPRVYVNLGSLMRVDITDKDAPTSKAWDLAIKRPVLFTNDGDGGVGKGGTIVVAKAFDQVTSADAMGTFASEAFVDANCNPKMDAAGDILTTFSNWYDYNQSTNVLTPKPNTTYVVRGATGTLYKVGIESYYATPTGGTGTLGAYYLLEVGAL